MRGARALEPAEMGLPRVVPLVARAVARFHRAGADFPLAPAGRDTAGRPMPVLWPTLERWSALALAEDAESSAAGADSSADGAAAGAGGAAAAVTAAAAAAAAAASASASVGASGAESRRRLRERIPRELAWLRRALLQRRPLADDEGADEGTGSVAAASVAAEAAEAAAFSAAEIVFAHNDLLSGNLLLVEEASVGADISSGEAGAAAGAGALAGARLQLIDFEYGAFNHRGFDLANHFCEHCGFDFALASHPSRATQHAFLRDYCAEAGLLQRFSGRATAAAATIDEGGEEGEDEAAFLDALQARIARYVLASDLWWGLWALVQARESAIDFDFAGYAARRLAAYDVHKAALFPAAPLHAPAAAEH